MRSNDPPTDILSAAEMQASLGKLTDVDFKRLDLIALVHTKGRRIAAEELLQEAFVRALEGKRRCPRNIGVVKFLEGVMRSLWSGLAKGAKGRPAVPLTATGDDKTIEIADPSPPQDRALAATQLWAAVLTLFADDPLAQRIVQATAEGFEGKELWSMLDIDETTYESTRRKILRRITARFPDGASL